MTADIFDIFFNFIYNKQCNVNLKICCCGSVGATRKKYADGIFLAKAAKGYARRPEERVLGKGILYKN